MRCSVKKCPEWLNRRARGKRWIICEQKYIFLNKVTQNFQPLAEKGGPWKPVGIIQPTILFGEQIYVTFMWHNQLSSWNFNCQKVFFFFFPFSKWKPWIPSTGQQWSFVAWRLVWKGVGLAKTIWNFGLRLLPPLHFNIRN